MTRRLMTWLEMQHQYYILDKNVSIDLEGIAKHELSRAKKGGAGG